MSWLAVGLAAYLSVGGLAGMVFWLVAWTALIGRGADVTVRVAELRDALNRGRLQGRDERATIVLYAVAITVLWLPVLPAYLRIRRGR